MREYEKKEKILWISGISGTAGGGADSGGKKPGGEAAGLEG